MQACEAAFLGGPVALAYSRFTDDDEGGGLCGISHLHRSLSQGEGYALPGEFVVVAGTK